LYKFKGFNEDQRRANFGDAKSLIRQALMSGRSEWIRRAGEPLPGWF
jgi:hypothetical protein